MARRQLSNILVAALILWVPAAQAQGIETLLTDGYSALQKRSYGKAQALLTQAVKTDPRSASARRYLAVAMAESGDPAGALSQIRAAQSINGVQPTDCLILGQSHFALSDLESAKKAYMAGLKSAQTFCPAALGLIRTYVSTGELSQASNLCSILSSKPLTVGQSAELRTLTNAINQANSRSPETLEKG